MTPEIVIEKGIKMDGGDRGRPSLTWAYKEAFLKMQPGDSFVISARHYQTVRNAAAKIGAKVTLKTIDYTPPPSRRPVRCWLVSAPTEFQKAA